MTNASMNVMIADTRVADNMPAMTGGAAKTDAAKDASRTDGRSFTDALKAAGGSLQSKESSETGKQSVTRRKKSDSKASGKSSQGGKTRKKTANTAKAKSKVNLSNELMAHSDELPENKLQIAAEQIQQNPKTESALKTGLPGVLLTNIGKSAGDRSGNKTTDRSLTINSKKSKSTSSASPPSRLESASAGLQTGLKNLSSVSRRVEVLDSRKSEIAEPSVKQSLQKSSSQRGVRRQTAATALKSGADQNTGANFSVAETDIDLSPESGKATSQRSAAAELARKLDAQAGSDIVRQVKVVLNRSDAGEVRINLRPDNLGRVRVRIRMENNRLTGRIFVESAAAREAFRNALDGLQAKLVESGFGSADLELAWDDGANSFAENKEQEQGQTSSSDRSAREFENMVPTTVVDEAVDGRVNLVV